MTSDSPITMADAPACTPTDQLEITARHGQKYSWHTGQCACGITIGEPTADAVRRAHGHHLTIPEPAAEAMSRPITVADMNHDYWFEGRGHWLAGRTDCEHGYRLTDYGHSCA